MDETAGLEASDARFRRVLGQYPTGVCVVTGITQDGQPAGLAVGSFTSLSLHPPLVAFMPDKTSSSWPKIRPANAFCVNILSAGQESVCRAFAAKAPDKFRQVSWRAASSGALHLCSRVRRGRHGTDLTWRPADPFAGQPEAIDVLRAPHARGIRPGHHVDRRQDSV